MSGITTIRATLTAGDIIGTNKNLRAVNIGASRVCACARRRSAHCSSVTIIISALAIIRFSIRRHKGLCRANLISTCVSNKSAKKGKQSKKAHRVCKDVLFVFVPLCRVFVFILSNTQTRVRLLGSDCCQPATWSRTWRGSGKISANLVSYLHYYLS